MLNIAIGLQLFASSVQPPLWNNEKCVSYQFVGIMPVRKTSFNICNKHSWILADPYKNISRITFSLSALFFFSLSSRYVVTRPKKKVEHCTMNHNSEWHQQWTHSSITQHIFVSLDLLSFSVSLDTWTVVPNVEYQRKPSNVLLFYFCEKSQLLSCFTQYLFK